MIRILDRMVARTFAVRFLLFVTSVPVIFVFSDLTERQGQLIDRDSRSDRSRSDTFSRSHTSSCGPRRSLH